MEAYAYSWANYSMQGAQTHYSQCLACVRNSLAIGKQTYEMREREKAKSSFILLVEEK